ncbi:uncharacterized protein KY384_005137 [Bacidia gigantensis]|uniref:uncharacterized protein n=1 Tax=Bacidia gigantensis TaxID=2732470 RepID=UPI001D04C591|nr:uncharacterized protein KY384_005137 [Bacidia gigantensis]KAG8529656.1 hypothetical protein KY384_005137 [Bacidia gigantensis]
MSPQKSAALPPPVRAPQSLQPPTSRSCPEDPRVIAQQKAAKIRAGREISGIQGKIADGRTSTSGSMGSGSLGVRSKIRHHGVPKASGYHSANANMVGGGVPMRLSANEVGDEGTYNGSVTGSSPPGPGRILHQRTNSGQSSVRDSRFLTVDTQQGRRFSQGSTPISAQSGSGHGEGIPELEEKEKGEEAVVSAGPKSATSSERENSFGKVGEMAPPVPRKDDVLGKKKDGDLERRGSVEVRKNPFTLFIANPDVDSDSD